VVATQTQFVRPLGKNFAFGRNGSSVNTKFSGSKVPYMTPQKGYFGCFLSLNSGLSPGVKCTVRVTAVNDGVKLGDQDCYYTGSGQVQPCDFPQSWTAVDRIEFNIVKTDSLAGLGNAVASTITGLTGGTVTDVGKIYYGLDNLTYEATPCSGDPTAKCSCA
jgi:hypothetical protein